jgi:hypothetical protein
VRLWDPEHRHDRVTHELLGRSAEPLHLAVHELEELPLELADVLGIEPLAERRGAREVGEEDGDDAALLPVVHDRGPLRVVAQGVPATRAERSRCGLLSSAAGAHAGERRAARAAEPRLRGLLGSTVGHATGTHRVYGSPPEDLDWVARGFPLRRLRQTRVRPTGSLG